MSCPGSTPAGEVLGDVEGDRHRPERAVGEPHLGADATRSRPCARKPLSGWKPPFIRSSRSQTWRWRQVPRRQVAGVDLELGGALGGNVELGDREQVARGHLGTSHHGFDARHSVLGHIPHPSTLIRFPRLSSSRPAAGSKRRASNRLILPRCSIRATASRDALPRAQPPGVASRNRAGIRSRYGKLGKYGRASCEHPGEGGPRQQPLEVGGRARMALGERLDDAGVEQRRRRRALHERRSGRRPPRSAPPSAARSSRRRCAAPPAPRRPRAGRARPPAAAGRGRSAASAPGRRGRRSGPRAGPPAGPAPPAAAAGSPRDTAGRDTR